MAYDSNSCLEDKRASNDLYLKENGCSVLY